MHDQAKYVPVIVDETTGTSTARKICSIAALITKKKKSTRRISLGCECYGVRNMSDDSVSSAINVIVKQRQVPIAFGCAHALNSGARCLKYSFAFSLPGRLDPVTLPGLGPPRRASFFSLARSMK